jgi:hypothetical protein
VIETHEHVGAWPYGRTTCGATGISERSFHDYCAKDAAFLAATQRARAQGRVRIVDSILDDRDWPGKAWYLERTAAEFARVAERPLLQPAELQEKINVAFILPDLKGKSLAEVANFPAVSTEQLRRRFAAAAGSQSQSQRKTKNQTATPILMSWGTMEIETPDPPRKRSAPNSRR